MTSYFASLPVVSYDGRQTIDVTRRVALRQAVVADPRALRPYDVPSGQRSDQIADYYYGDPEREWLVWLSAQVLDPYHDWYLTYEDLQAFVVDKYGSMEEAQERVHHWQVNWYDDDSETSVDGFEVLPYQLKKYYEPIFASDTGRVLAYARREEDASCSTNMVVTISAAGPALSADERVQVWSGPDFQGDCETRWANSSQVVLVHVQAGLQPGYTLLGMSSGSATTIQSVAYTANVIPVDERSYWSPVTMWDWENDLNESKKSVRLIDSSYASEMEIELTRLMK